MSKIKVSACIVTYNNVKYIEKAASTLLDSVKRPDIDFCLWFVDNGSTDGTLELIKEKFTESEKYKDRTYIIENPENIGFGAAHNLMLGEDSDYHCVVNPDVVIEDDIIDEMVSFMEEEQNKSVVQLSPRICFPDGRDQILGKRNPHLIYLAASRLRGDEPSKLLRRYAMLDKGTDEPFAIKNATGCFMFFRTSAFKQVGGFDERYFMYFEDCDITRKMNRLGKVIYFPQVIVYHVWARDSKRSTKLKIIHIQSMLKYYLKWKTI